MEIKKVFRLFGYCINGDIETVEEFDTEEEAITRIKNIDFNDSDSLYFQSQATIFEIKQFYKICFKED